MDQLTPDNEFDRLLQDWARKQPAVPANELNTWTQILAATEPPVVVARTRRRADIAAISAAAVAACALAAVILWRTAPSPQVQPSPPEVVAFPRQHLEALAKESRALFDRRVRWFAETNQELLFGIDEAADANDPPPQVAVQVVVFRRQKGGTQWNESLRTSVVLRADEPVQIDLPQDHSQLRLWAHILPDRAVCVDSDYRQADHDSAGWQASMATLEKQPELVVATQDGADEVQVWQSAVVLSEDPL